jgi:hypothetical protein
MERMQLTKEARGLEVVATIKTMGPRATSELRLDLRQQVAIFAMVQQIADMVGTPMPEQIYLGLQTKTVFRPRRWPAVLSHPSSLVVGLPLLLTLSVDEFRFVLAFVIQASPIQRNSRLGLLLSGEDGSWKSRLRTRENGDRLLGPSVLEGSCSSVVMPTGNAETDVQFAGLSSFPPGLTLGVPAFDRCLTAIEDLGFVYDYYFSEIYAKLLEDGFKPPLSTGLEMFLRDGAMGDVLCRSRTEKDTEEMASRTLHHRLIASTSFPLLPHVSETPAISLIDNYPELESELAGLHAQSTYGSSPSALQWAEVGRTLYLEQWKYFAHSQRHRIVGVTPESVPRVIPRSKPPSVTSPDPRGPGGPEAQDSINAVVACALAVLLVQEGASLEAWPGRTIALHLRGVTFRPFVDIYELSIGEMSDEVWIDRCSKAAILAVDLGALEMET